MALKKYFRKKRSMRKVAGKSVVSRKRYYRKSRYDKYLTRTIQPNIAYVQMKYSTSILINPGLGGSAVYHFRANSIYDPDHTGAGHQPSLHDLYQMLYQHYEVLGSKIIVRPMPVPELTEPQAGSRLMQVAITAIQSTAEGTLDYEEIREFKRGPIMYVNDNSVVNGRGSFIVKGWSKRRWFGKESPQETASGFGSNPNAEAFFRIQGSAVSSTIDPVPLNVLVDVHYYVKLTRPITQTKS